MIVRTAREDEHKELVSMLNSAGIVNVGVGYKESETFVAENDREIIGMFTILLPIIYKYPALVHLFVSKRFRCSNFAVSIIGRLKALCLSRDWDKLLIDSSGDDRVDNFTRRKFNIEQEIIGRRGHRYFLARIA